ncbi:MAG: pyridoxal 5'-phosphate synthase glutaminase subunit PdxT [Thermoleophilia bacterium]
MRIGVLALQGNFREHLALLEGLGVEGSEVRLPGHLDGLDGLVIPGGESTSIGKLMRLYGMDGAIAAFDRPVLGTCAGMIVLARDAVDGVPDQVQLGLIDLTVRRNGFGRQVHSFESDVELVGDPTPLHGVFIRAPRVERVGDGVEVLARLGDEPVLLGQGRVLVASFHPELTGDTRVHERLVALAARPEAAKEGSVGRP